MSKRKGLSIDDKRGRVMDLLYEKKDVLNYKELEKAATSAGVVAQSVKDIVNSLIADNYIQSDKIGTSVYYWAFPGHILESRKVRLSEMDCKRESNKEELKKLQAEYETEKNLRSDAEEERQKLFAELEALKKQESQLAEELTEYADSDPQVIAAEEKELQIAFDGANRWTDNLSNLRTWLKNKFGMSDAEFTAQTGIPEDLEYFSLDPPSKA